MSPSSTRIAVYPGSFDPITRGHEDLVLRSLHFADRVIVAVAVNATKQPLFSLEERVALIRQAVTHPAVEVQSFDGLLVDFARRVGASVTVRARAEDGGEKTFEATVRIDSAIEVEYFRHGGVLQMVLRRLLPA